LRKGRTDWMSNVLLQGAKGELCKRIEREIEISKVKSSLRKQSLQRNKGEVKNGRRNDFVEEVCKWRLEEGEIAQGTEGQRVNAKNQR
jgi:hypothetical protein